MKKLFKIIVHALSLAWEWLKPIEKKAVSWAVEITNAVKEFDTEHPEAADIITKIIPGDIDDVIKERIRAALPDIMIKLRLIQATEGLTDPAEIVLAGAKVLQSFEGLVRNTAYNDFVIFLTDAAADGQIDWKDLAYLPKWKYDNDPDPEVDTAVESDVA